MSAVRRWGYFGIAISASIVTGLFIYVGLTQPALTRASTPAIGPMFSPGYEQNIQSGQTVSFTHVLTNADVDADSFAITATTPVTWPMELWASAPLTDPQPLSLTLGAGATATIHISLSLPDDLSIISGTQAIIALTATSQITADRFATLTDTVVVQTPTQAFSYTVYLPNIARNGGVQLVQLGSDFGPSLLLSDTSVLTTDVGLARSLGTTWTRAWLPWALIETAPGQYDWSWADQQINQFAQAGYKIDAVFYYPPTWAATNGCGPITNTAALEQFLTVLVTRYKDQVSAWEFFNEPDSLNGYPQYGPVIGCWAPQPQAYADVLAHFHDRIKALDPTALVVLGGLAYDNWAVFDRNFITNTLQSGSGPYFDVVSLHFYPTNPQDFPTMADKINDIKAILQRHNVYHKLIWMTESSMWTNSPGGSLDIQKNYIVKEQTRGYCAGADKIFWYAIREELNPPALNRWLINKQHQFDQGYATYRNYAHQIDGAFCRGRKTQVPANVEAYQFGRPDGEVYILWANSGTAQVALPAGSAAVLIDRDGTTSQTLPASGGMVSVFVNMQPIFVIVKN